MTSGTVLSPSSSTDRRWWGHPFSEYRWQTELVRLLADPVWRGVGVRDGGGAPVLMIPGFLSGDASFMYMRRWLNRSSFRSYRSGISWNVDCASQTLRRLEGRLDAAAARSGTKVHIVAHSRGGMLGRALVRRRPDLIAQLITLGSPLAAEFDCSVPVAAAVAGARWAQNLIRPETRREGCFTSHCLCGYSAALHAALPEAVPLTSIYTTEDGIVRPEACMPPDADCIAVRGSHLGLVVNADVYRQVARLLTSTTP